LHYFQDILEHWLTASLLSTWGQGGLSL